jgi:DNA repair protein RecN (Recombination protein N)
MLVELFIKNIAVIEEVRLHCGQGFHVLTGETGAGKSIIIDALTLIAGGRGSLELIRFDCDRAEVEAVFDLPATHRVWHMLDVQGVRYTDGDQLIIRRELTSQGKSFHRINGQSVNLSVLREISESLVNIHGQHEHQSLFKTERHIDWLDLYGGDVIVTLKEEYVENHKQYLQLQKQLQEFQHNDRQSRQMADLYRFQLEEIQQARLKIGEDEHLNQERRRLSNAERLYSAADGVYESLSGQHSALLSLNQALTKLREMSKYDELFGVPLLEQLESAYYQAEDVAIQIRDYRDGIEFNPDRLNKIEKRLDIISQLKKKYGTEIADILTHEQKISEQLSRIENHEQYVTEIQAELQLKSERLMHIGNKLSNVRSVVAESLASAIMYQLAHLQMERTQFSVRIESSTDFRKHGLDNVEFLFSANPGEPLRPLTKVASGGECSRLMLAMQTIFSSMEDIPVLVFDEVDTGVSGRAAQAIAEKMQEVANQCQVFAITHLPQVACMADHHYLIEKHVFENRTVTSVKLMSLEQRVEELARMLGGTQLTDKTRDHAREMIEMAKRDNQKVRK